jgi:hypothetical protein
MLRSRAPAVELRVVRAHDHREVRPDQDGDERGQDEDVDDEQS